MIERVQPSWCNKNYNIEWRWANGTIRTTSAMLKYVDDGYFYFEYPNGGLFIVEQDAIRSLECIEEIKHDGT